MKGANIMQDDIYALMELIKETTFLYNLTHEHKARFNIVWEKNTGYCHIVCSRGGKREKVGAWSGTVKSVCRQVRTANKKARAGIEKKKEEATHKKKPLF